MPQYDLANTFVPTRDDWDRAEVMMEPGLAFGMWLVDGFCPNGAAFETHYGDTWDWQAVTDELIQRGMIERDGTTFRVTEKGRPILDLLHSSEK